MTEPECYIVLEMIGTPGESADGKGCIKIHDVCDTHAEAEQSLFDNCRKRENAAVFPIDGYMGPNLDKWLLACGIGNVFERADAIRTIGHTLLTMMKDEDDG
jgi:hypothetical protein